METLWFIVISLMLAAYVVLDGFDFGAGILHLFVARTDAERRTVLGAVGPVWDGNEVWLIASGGVIVFAFPRAYAAGFSGFYLPLMMVLWLLILRGLSIEFRSKEASPLWRSLWDGLFFVSSALMAIVLGAAMGNLIRGVPLDQSGYFSGPLFTNFQLGAHPGVLDWYTVSVGVLALLVLALHGALYLIWKTPGEVNRRCRVAAKFLWPSVLAVGIAVTYMTSQVQPLIFHNLSNRVWIWPIALLVPASLAAVAFLLKDKRELPAFLASAVFIAMLLASTAAGAFPNILISTLSPAYTVTVSNGSSGALGLRIGVAIWSIAIVLAIGYFAYLFHSFRGKVDVETDTHGH